MTTETQSSPTQSTSEAQEVQPVASFADSIPEPGQQSTRRSRTSRSLDGSLRRSVALNNANANSFSRRKMGRKLDTSRHRAIALIDGSRHRSLALDALLANDADQEGSGGKKNYEEVNAWANYQNTGQQARPIDARGRQYIVKNDVLSASRHRHALPGLSRDEEQPQARPDFDRYFEKANSAHFSIDSGARTDVHAKAKKSIKEIFGVFFQGDFEDTKKHYFVTDKLSFLYGTMPWLQPWIVSNLPFPSLLLFVELCLRGIGQVFFQNSPLSGLLILIGLYLQSTRVATHGLISLVSGNLIALALGFDLGLMRSGLFGYNAFLVGLCLATFHSPEKHSDWSVSISIASALYAGFSSILFVFMGKLLVSFKAPPLTLPFCFASLMFLSSTPNMAKISYDPVVDPALPTYNGETPPVNISVNEFAEGVIRSIGQVFLANEIVSGILVLVGIGVCSRISAAAALAGAVIGNLMALLVGVPAAGLEQGLYGFSSSLTFTSIFLFYVPDFGATLLATIATVFTALMQHSLATYFKPYGLPVLTLPFCFVSLPFIILQGTTNRVIAVPLETMTIPEDHLARVQALRKGFGYLESILNSVDLKRQSSMSKVVQRELSNVASQALGQSTRKISLRRTLFSKEEEEYIDLFTYMRKESEKVIRVEDFVASLRGAGLDGEVGLSFATLVLLEMDLDNSGSIDQDEFIVFCAVSKSMRLIRRNIARFFDFVDMDGNHCIDLDEIDAALEYLGEDILSEEERFAIIDMMGIEDETREIDTVQFINRVTMANIKRSISEFHDSMSSTARTSS